MVPRGIAMMPPRGQPAGKDARVHEAFFGLSEGGVYIHLSPRGLNPAKGAGHSAASGLRWKRADVPGLHGPVGALPGIATNESWLPYRVGSPVRSDGRAHFRSWFDVFKPSVPHRRVGALRSILCGEAICRSGAGP